MIIRAGTGNSGGKRPAGNATNIPGATTNPANNVASNSATLYGTVNPHGLTTTVYFQAPGTTISYGKLQHRTQTFTGNTTPSVTANLSECSDCEQDVPFPQFRSPYQCGTTYGNDRTLHHA